MGYEDDTTIYAVIPRPLSCSQVMESLNQELATIKSWRLKRHLMLNPKKTKSIVVNRSQTIAPNYGGLTLGGAKLGEVKGLRTLGVT